MHDKHYLENELSERVSRDPEIFEFLQSGSLDAIGYWDLENPEHEWISHRFWEVLGFDPAGMKHLASEWQDMIHQDDLKVALENLHHHCADPAHNFDQYVRYRHKDGSTVWVRCRGIAIRDENGKHGMARMVFDDRAAQDPERRLRFDIRPIPVAHATEPMIRQVWQNLIGNAIKFTRDRDVGEIEIGVRVGEETAVDLLKNGSTDFVLKDRLGRLVPAIRRAFREVGDREARRKAEADLRALNEQLEQRVTERTRELRERNEIVEEDLRMARELQVALLPHRFPTLPPGVSEAASAVRFFSAFYPASALSGDSFNVVPVSDVAVGVFICDVMGHGIRAALVSAMMRALEEQLGESAGDPGALLTDLNRALCGILRQSGMTLFATACYGIVNVATSRIRFASAGHPSPLLVRRALHEVRPLVAPDEAGPALDLFDDARFVTREVPAVVGDLILLFTDGIFEVENAEAEAFGEHRLRESILARCGEPSAQIIRGLYDEVERFAGGHPFPDDVCLVGVEIADLRRATGKRKAMSRVGRVPAHARDSSIG